MSKKNMEEKNLKETSVTEEAAAPEAEETAAKESKAEKKPKKQYTPEEEAKRALNKVKRRKKMKYGALSTVITLVIVAIIIVANVICNVLDKRYNWNIDLTSSGLYQIDEQTIGYLNKLNTDIEMVVLAEESNYQENSKLKIVQETLNRFQAESNGHISVKYVNMTKNPELVKPYQDKYDGEFEEGDVVVTAGELLRVVPFDNLISRTQSIDYTTYQYVYNYTFIGEQSLLSAVAGVTDLNPVTVALINTTGGSSLYSQYDTYNFMAVQDLLEKNNYTVKAMDIANDEFPEGTMMAVLCAPANDLSEAQIKKLTDFLYNDGKYGRKLIYFASLYQQQETKNLDEFLEVWGIEVGRSYLQEGDEKTAQYVLMAVGQANGIPTATLTDSEINASAVDTKLPVIAPLGRPIKQLFESNAGRTTEALLTTAKTTFVVPFDADETFSKDDAETGSFPVAVHAAQYFRIGDDQQEVSSTVTAFGSAFMLDPMIVQSKSYNNSGYFVSVVNALSGKESLITIAEKSLNSTQITITDAQAKAIRNVVIIFLPLAVAIIGVVVYLRRRNR